MARVNETIALELSLKQRDRSYASLHDFCVGLDKARSECNGDVKIEVDQEITSEMGQEESSMPMEELVPDPGCGSSSSDLDTAADIPLDLSMRGNETETNDQDLELPELGRDETWSSLFDNETNLSTMDCDDIFFGARAGEGENQDIVSPPTFFEYYSASDNFNDIKQQSDNYGDGARSGFEIGDRDDTAAELPLMITLDSEGVYSTQSQDLDLESEGEENGGEESNETDANVISNLLPSSEADSTSIQGFPGEATETIDSNENLETEAGPELPPDESSSFFHMEFAASENAKEQHSKDLEPVQPTAKSGSQILGEKKTRKRRKRRRTLKFSVSTSPLVAKVRKNRKKNLHVILEDALNDLESKIKAADNEDKCKGNKYMEANELLDQAEGFYKQVKKARDNAKDRSKALKILSELEVRSSNLYIDMLEKVSQLSSSVRAEQGRQSARRRRGDNV